MELEWVRVRGYRSLRDVTVDFGRCTLIIGSNGVGKTNVYRALRLVSDAAIGTLGRSIADEGGMQSIRWAGPRRKDERATRIELGFDALTYSLSLSLPNPHGFGFETRFTRDPHVSSETITVREGKRRIALLERSAASCTVVDDTGKRAVYAANLVGSESVLSQIVDPRTYEVLTTMRNLFACYRFYHHFRTDPEAAAREPRVGTRTPILAHDGADLASAIETIFEVGDGGGFRAHVDRAFPGSRVEVAVSEDGRFVVTMSSPGIHRPLAARELSDGTLRYLCLLAALCSPHPAPLLVLNEPETSLHPDLLAALVAPIVAAQAKSQIVVLTHAHAFADAIAERANATRVELSRIDGATRVVRSQ